MNPRPAAHSQAATDWAGNGRELQRVVGVESAPEPFRELIAEPHRAIFANRHVEGSVRIARNTRAIPVSSDKLTDTRGRLRELQSVFANCNEHCAHHVPSLMLRHATRSPANTSGVYGAATGAVKPTSVAAAGIGIIWNDANGEQYECYKRSEDTTEHDTSSLAIIVRAGKTATARAREVAVDQRNAIACRPHLRSQARSPR